jgi:hypothetical protein
MTAACDNTYQETRPDSFELVDFVIDIFLPQLHGWCSPDKAKHLARLVAQGRGPLSVELGVYGGRGLLAMALAHRHVLGLGVAHGIDPYSSSAALEGSNRDIDRQWWSAVNYEAIQKSASLALSVLAGRCAKLIVSRSQDVADSYEEGSIGVLHQDSNHSREVSCDEVVRWMPKLAEHGYWVFDDTDWPTTKEAQELLVSSGFAKIEDHGGWAVFQR